MAEDLEVTSAEQWRSARKAGELVPLPSGQVARLRRSMDITTLIRTGKVPNRLLKLMQQAQTGNMPDMADVDVNEMRDMAELIDVIVLHAFVEPKVVAPPEGEDPDLWEPPPGCISLYDIDTVDKTFVYQYAQGTVQDVESFRILQDAMLATLQNEQPVQNNTKRTTRAKGRVRSVVSG